MTPIRAVLMGLGTVFFFFRLAWGQTPNVYEIGIRPISKILTQDQYEIKGVVYPFTPDRDPQSGSERGREYLAPNLPSEAKGFVLVHGLLENSRIWRDIGAERSKHGLVVMINVRGHGRGEHRSLPVSGAKRGAEGTDAMSIEGGDIDATIREIFQWTHRKIVLVGHSNGGMISRQWLKGAVSSVGRLRY